MALVEGAMRGHVQEVFSSIQGEGLWAGRFQHFVRLKGCRIGCAYCDTPEAASPGRPPPASAASHPMTPDRVVDLLRREAAQWPGAHSFSLTGGEPLEQLDFLGALIDALRGSFPVMPVMLETAGIHSGPMRLVADRVDLVSMDFKLPSTSGLTGMRARHERFMAALEGRPFYVKAVVDPGTPRREVRDAAESVAACDPRVAFFLQPVTRQGRIEGGAYLLDLWEEARRVLADARVLPQVHGLLSLV